MLARWWKTINDILVEKAEDFGFKEDLAIIALMTTTDCTTFENLVNVLNQMYIHRLYDTNYFNAVETLRVDIRHLKEKIFHKVIKYQFMCVLCKEHKVDTVFLMCGHIVVCNKCSKLTQCKSYVTSPIRI